MEYLKWEMLEKQITKLYLQSLTLIQMCQSMQRLAPKDNNIYFQFLAVEIYTMCQWDIQLPTLHKSELTESIQKQHHVLVLIVAIILPTGDLDRSANLDQSWVNWGKPEFLFHFTFTPMLGESHGQVVAMVGEKGQGPTSVACFLHLCLCPSIRQSL